MSFPLPDYISMQGATEIIEISIEQLRRLVEEKRLSAYIIRKCHLTIDPPVYTEMIAPQWHKNKLFIHSMYAVIEDNVNPCLCNAMYDEVNNYEYSDIFIKPADLRALQNDHNGQKTLSTELPTKDSKAELVKLHVFKPEERKAKDKSAIQLAVEAYLDTTPDGNKAGFYNFLKAKIKLVTEEVLKAGESYPYYFKRVTIEGSKEGIYLNHPKEGKKEGEAGYNHYSKSAISSLISTEKGKRN